MLARQMKQGRNVAKEQDLEALVENLLRDAGLTYVRHPIVGATRPDFAVTTDQGDQIVIEVKAWDDTPENNARAAHQVRRYKELSNAAAVMLVTCIDAAVFTAFGGVYPASEVIPALRDLVVTLTRKVSVPKSVQSRASPDKKVFASMPFSGQYDDTFLVGIQPAALALDAVADRVDHTGRSGDIVQQIKEMIRSAQAVVADLSESRANVCHEIGYAEALGKPVLQICCTPIDSLPFNLRNNKTIPYNRGQVSKLRIKLENEMAKVL